MRLTREQREALKELEIDIDIMRSKIALTRSAQENWPTRRRRLVDLLKKDRWELKVLQTRITLREEKLAEGDAVYADPNLQRRKIAEMEERLEELEERRRSPEFNPKVARCHRIAGQFRDLLSELSPEKREELLEMLTAEQSG